jgi:hypothetical protein
MSKYLPVLLAALVAIAPFAAARAEPLPPVAAVVAMLDNPESLRPASFISDIQQMPAPHVGAIVAGAFIGGVVIDTVLDGGLFTILGVLAGAGFGNEWYERHWWPFH